jgi:glycosyltransferase involved in cell wall biosynthesis
MDENHSNNHLISAIVLTYNEEQNIGRCLESVQDLCEIFVVDSGSNDRTVEICREYGVQVFHHEYANHSSQWQWALDHLPLSTKWILILDADFVLTQELKREIRNKLPHLSRDIDGVFVVHRYVFGGNVIRFGGTKKHWLRIIRREKAKVDLSDLVDFRFVVDGRTVRFSGAILEENYMDQDISLWTKKQDKFALRFAVEEELRRRGLLRWGKTPKYFGNSDERFMWLRDRWLRLPLFVRPVLYVLYRYFLRLGFLDGKGGFAYHFLQGFWLRTVVDWKINQLRNLRLTGEELLLLKEKMLTVREGSVELLCRSIRKEDAASLT